MNPETVSPTLNYGVKGATHSSYRPNRVYPQTGGGVAVALSSSVSESQFELPVKVLNMSKTTLDFTVYVPATASKCTAIHTAGCPFIDSISLLSREGLEICRINNLPRYLRSVLPVVTKLEKFLTYGQSNGALTAILADVKDKGPSFNRSNAHVDGATDTGADLGVNSRRISTIQTANATAYVNADINFTEPQYVKESADNGAQYCNYSIPLALLAPHTILSVDRNMYFGGQQVILRIQWSPLSHIGFVYTDSGLPLSDTVIAAAATITNLQLMVAVEQNPINVNSLVGTMAQAPATFSIPFVNTYVYAPGASTSTSHQQKYNRSHGKKLLNIYSAVYNASSNPIFYLDSSNINYTNTTGDGINMGKINSYNPTLNSSNLNEYVINELKAEGYELMKPLLEGSVVQSRSMYDYNRVYISSWRRGRSCEWIDLDGREDDGLDLNTEANYVMDYQNQRAADDAANAVTLNEYQWAITLRDLTISPGGSISLV